ncbi:hypothetical protein FLAG1_11242, partial [Fusarium langsethiae]
MSNSDPTRSPEFLESTILWTVIYKLDIDINNRVGAKSFFKQHEAWIIESDYGSVLDSIPPDYDIWVDATPFVLGVKSGNETSIGQQAEVFISGKTPLEKWTEDPHAECTDITLLRSSNQLISDFQLHNSGIFTVYDKCESFDRKDQKEPMFLKEGKAGIISLSGIVRQLQVFGTIFDHFTLVHSYSSIFLTRSLQLPSRTWEAPMENMAAFFQAGPLTLPVDVGGYDPDHPLSTLTVKDRFFRNTALPSLPEGDWSLLQPFVGKTPGSRLPLHNAFGIDTRLSIHTR